MTSTPDRTQCPFCLAKVPLKEGGRFYTHRWGRPGALKPCPGAGRTKEEAKAAKSAGPPYEVLSGEKASMQPEDIF